MAYKDLHETPFDDSTIAKLEIFEDYTQAWLPTFIMQGITPICIFDFFAGTGYDKAGIEGSPIRILQKIEEQVENCVAKGVSIELYINEFDVKKYELLVSNCELFLNQRPKLSKCLKLIYRNVDFDYCFREFLPTIRRCPSLVFLDQNGIKFLSKTYLLELEKTQQTDFLYFVSSSYMWRFGDTEEFKKYLPFDLKEAKRDPYRLIHRNLLRQLKLQLPTQTQIKLYPFSIKKGTNIYGIIFGASHIRAVDKFLALTWKRNTVNGEADFDIDNDLQKQQLDLFAPDNRKLTKIAAFQQQLRENILDSKISTNIEAYTFTMDEGHIPEHARTELRKMKDEGVIQYFGHPKVSYDAWSGNEIVKFEKTKK